MTDPLDAIRENNRTVQDRMLYVSTFVHSCVFVCIATIVAITTLAIVRPESGSTVSTIIGIATPITIGLMAAAVNGVYKGVDSRLSQLLVTASQQADLDARGDVIRDMYRRLSSLEQGTPEYETLNEQIRAETWKHFGIVERRSAPLSLNGKTKHAT